MRVCCFEKFPKTPQKLLSSKSEFDGRRSGFSGFKEFQGFSGFDIFNRFGELGTYSMDY